jgi:hypothetical protein
MAAKPTQSREGVKGQLPLAESRGGASGGAWGNAPTVPRATSYAKRAQQRAQAAQRPCAVTLRVRRRAPKLLFQPIQHCRARWARLTSIGNDSFLGAGLFRCRDFASAEATRGLCGRPLDCFAAHTPIIDFVCCMENRVYGHNSGAQNPPHAKSRRVLPAAAIVIHKDSTFLALIPHPCPRTLPAPSLPPPSRRRGGRSTS